MARGICVFAEHWEEQLSPVFYELVLAAQKIGKTTGEPIQVILAAREPEHLLGQMSGLPLDQIYVTRLSQDYLFQDEVLSEIYQPRCWSRSSQVSSWYRPVTREDPSSQGWLID